MAKDPNFVLQMIRIGDAAALENNDGISCQTDPSPWLTELNAFDCKTYSGPLMAMKQGGGYDLVALDMKTGATSLIYNIVKNSSYIPWKALNAFAYSPYDSVGYAALTLDDWDMSIFPTPPPFYVIRYDKVKIEFMAKVQPFMGRPIGATFDMAGNYYVVSNPSILMLPKPQLLKGKREYDDKDLPFYDMNSSIVIIKEMVGVEQIADIVEVKANFDGKGIAEWLLGVNSKQQMVVIKLDGKYDYFIVGTNDVMAGWEERQNFGSAWNLDGEVFVSSNDGLGVFKVPLDKIKVPNGPNITLTLAGKSPATSNNDGLNCFGTGTYN